MGGRWAKAALGAALLVSAGAGCEPSEDTVLDATPTTASTTPTSTTTTVVTTTTTTTTTSTSTTTPSTTAPTTTPPPPPPAPVAPAQVAPACHPSYAGVCLPPDAEDVDCPGGSGNGPVYASGQDFSVVGPDEYDLDRNGDGIACESR